MRTCDDDGDGGPAGPAAATAPFTIRRYRPQDREAVREICRVTAHRNRGFELTFEDPEVFADYWSRYYTDFEPGSCLVAEIEGRVVGYLLGCHDSRRHARIMGLRILPKVVLRILWKLATRQYTNPASFRMLRWTIRKSWREAPAVPLDEYPAHYHCNLLREAQRRNLYTQLVMQFLDELEAAGVRGLHGTIEEPLSGGPWLRMVRAVNGTPAYYREFPTSMHEDVFGKAGQPWVIRVWGDTAARYRLFVAVAGEKFNL